MLAIFIAIQVISSLNFSAPQLSSFSIDSTIVLGVTSVILSINKEGELKQFLPGKIYFEMNNNSLIFGKLGYITDEEITIQRINDNKFYSYQPAQTILYENGLFHNVIFTYEGITAIQAKCLPLKDLNLKE